MTSMHFHFSADGGCAFHRALQPVRFCNPDLIELGIELSVSDRIEQKDWLVIHGLPATWDELHKVLKLKRKGVKLCWSLDDDYPSIPDWNPAKVTEDGMVVFDVMARSADAVIVSTNALHCAMDGILPDGVRIHTCPNLLDIETFPESPYDGASFAEVSVEWPIRFVWAGSMTHRGDVAVIEDALIRLLDKHGPKVVAVIFAGSLPPSGLMWKYLHAGCISGPAVPFSQYRKMANGLNPDVWLAPLADIPFNLSKSNLRVMEGWALGACVVASAVGEYNCIRHGEDGFTCSNSDSWFAVLDHLVLDHQTRVQMSANGRARARAVCDWRNPVNRKPWIDAIQAISEL